MSTTNDGKDIVSRAAVETAVTIKVGMDVHAAKAAVCVQIDGATPQPAQFVASERLLGWIAALRARHPGARVVSCYEAGPFGYHLHRQLVAAGIENVVVTPQRLDLDGRGQKTDRLDAHALAERLDRYHRGNRHALSIVRVPTPEQEQARARVRLRDQLLRTRRKHEARGRSILLAQGIRVQGPWWRPAAWAGLAPDLPAWLRDQVGIWQQLAFQADTLDRKIRAEIEAEAPKQLPRGVGALTWVILMREVLDWSRFKNRRQVASYTGLCPGIHQSGERARYRSINRHGNPAVRHALIELTWRLARWQPQYPPVRKLVEQGLAPRLRRKAVVAAARRLAIDLWRLATHQTTPEKIGLTAIFAGAA
jgi:transposase